VKARSLGISFIAAVIVPSILLAVLSIRSAGREEAWRERQVTTALESEVTSAAGLADAEVGRVVDELRTGLDVPAGGDYAARLGRWKNRTPLVGVAFLLSPRYGILWPPSGARADAEQRRFLKENGDFLGNRAATSVLQNIAVKYQGEILADARPRDDRARAAEGPSAPPAGPSRPPQVRSDFAQGCRPGPTNGNRHLRAESRDPEQGLQGSPGEGRPAQRPDRFARGPVRQRAGARGFADASSRGARIVR